MIVVLGDLIADLSLHFPSFPVRAKDMYPLEFVDLGAGGACNVAIMAARFGLPVSALGELGRDRFGDIVAAELQAEGIDIDAVVRNAGSVTPLAGVLVDQAGEPAYLGFGGSLRLRELPEHWPPLIESAEAVFADGWVESQVGADMILAAFRIAKKAGVPVFFDPGPGNPKFDRKWQSSALADTEVLLLNEAEAGRLVGDQQPAHGLLERGPQLVMVKRGSAGCLALDHQQRLSVDGYPVEAIDATGAGDSFDGAVIYGYLQGLPLRELAKLANAAGAAKVSKRGTGRRLPQLTEVRDVLARFGDELAGWKP